MIIFLFVSLVEFVGSDGSMAIIYLDLMTAEPVK